MKWSFFSLSVVLSMMLLHTGAFGQTAVTQDRLLDALDGLWQEHGRQPTPEEIESGSEFTEDQYLRAWESWEAVRSALADHLYQKGVLAALQNDRPAALAFYRRCLSINPQHAEARSSYNNLNRVDLNQAAQERPQYTTRRAGREAVDAYRLFSLAYSRGNNQEAEQHYMRARRLKDEYTAEAVQRLQTQLQEAITAFEEEDFRRAERMFTELNNLTDADAGYKEAIEPASGDIAGYLNDVQITRDNLRVNSVLNVTRSSKVTIWATGSYYGAPSDLGIKITTLRTLQSFDLSTGSFVGPNAGASFRFTDRIWGGVEWAWMVRSPVIKYQSGVFQAEAPIDGGSVHSFSAFVQPGTYLSDQVRLYGQAGLSLFRVNLPSTRLNLVNDTTIGASETPLGFLVGGGVEFYNTTIGNVAWGFRMDAKYHIVQTKTEDAANQNQQIDLNGIRFGFGIVFALGGEQ